MWAWLSPVLGFLGGPVIKGALDAYKARLQTASDRELMDHDLAAKELLVDVKQAELNTQYRIAILGRWYEPVNLMAYILVVYFGKVYLYDAAFHLGSTDAVHGAVGDWAGMLVAFLVGKRGIENVARILRR